MGKSDKIGNGAALVAVSIKAFGRLSANSYMKALIQAPFVWVYSSRSAGKGPYMHLQLVIKMMSGIGKAETK